MKALARYLLAKARRRTEALSFMAYVTDSLRSIPQMSYLNERWYDMMRRRREPERNAEEIVDDVVGRLEGTD